MAFGFYFDNTRCTGCKTCQMACKDYHDLDASVTFRRVIDYEGGGWSIPFEGAQPEHHQVFAYHLSLSCNHCTNAACVRVCPTGAMHKDEAGLVWPDHHRCIGCGYCTMACPYHAPFIDQRLKKSSKCDGCKERQHDGLLPICIEACPVRALECGDPIALTAQHPQTVCSILPLPPESATRPNLFIKASPAARIAERSDARGIANGEEIV